MKILVHELKEVDLNEQNKKEVALNYLKSLIPGDYIKNGIIYRYYKDHGSGHEQKIREASVMEVHIYETILNIQGL